MSSSGEPFSSSEDTQIYSVTANCIAYMKPTSVAGFIGVDRLMFLLVGTSVVWKMILTLSELEDTPSNLLDRFPPTPRSWYQECKRMCPGMSRFVINFQIRDHDSCSFGDRSRAHQYLLNSLQKVMSCNKAWPCNRLSWVPYAE